MKKILAMMIAAMMIMSLAACGGAQSSDTLKQWDTPVVEQPDLSTEETDVKTHVDLSTLEFDVAEEVYVDENGNFQQGLEKNSEGAVLVSESGVKITAKTLTDSETNEAKFLTLQFENNSGVNLIFQCPTGTINGYMVSPALSVEVANKSEVEGVLKFTDKELALLEIDALIDASFGFRIFDAESFDDYIDTSMIKIKTSIEEIPRYISDDADTVIYDENNIKITTKGLDRENDIMEIRLPIYIENNTDNPITVTTKTISINGTEVDVIFYQEAFSQMRAIGTINFFGSDLIDKQIEKIETADLSFQIIDPATGDVIFETPTVIARY